MNIYKYINEEIDIANLKSVSMAKQLASKMAIVAQEEYDNWDESDEDTYAGGGICHFIAERIVEVLDDAGIEAMSVSSAHEQHVYTVSVFKEGVYNIDIPWSVYERGGGFTWNKIPNVKITANDVDFYRVSSDPNTYSEYAEEY